MEIVICSDYGTFILTPMAAMRICRAKGISAAKLEEYEHDDSRSAFEMVYNPRTTSERYLLKNYNIDSLEFRTDKDVVAVFKDEILKGRAEDYKVIEVPDEYAGKIHICNYDGKEWIAENHQVWGDDLSVWR
jgi:hypothetical protein